MLKKLQAKILVLVLCVAITFSAVVGMYDFEAFNAMQNSAGGGTLDLEDVTGRLSLDEVKEGQYNSYVTEKPQELTGSGSVIVKAEGDDLFDYYEKRNSKSEFSDFVTSSVGKRYTNSLKSKHKKILSAMEKMGIEYKLKYSYTALTNAFSVEVDYSDVAKIEKISGVKSVYYSNHYAVPEVTVSTNDANVYSTGIYDSSKVGYDGAGTVVAVLDTGLDYTHNAFLNMPKSKEGIWDKDYIESKFEGTLAKTERMPSATASDVYINEKVPYAFDYADDDCNVYPSYSTHGTHVAGIIAGRDDEKTVGANGEKFIGVAPEAQLVIMKVFTDDLDSHMLGGADTDDILAAIHDCAVLGVDVINMSLGSSGGFTSESTNEFLSEVYGRVDALGISLIVAAGNESSSGYGGGNGMNLASNPDSGTVGSPSTYGPALSVASINGQESPYFIANIADNGGTSAFVTNAADMYSNDVKFVELLMEQFSDLVDAEGNLELNYVVVPGIGRVNNYTPTVTRALADGRTLALVKRGDISFAEKVQNAMARGAIGVVIYNNLSGEIRMSLADVEDPVPTCSIGLNEGTAMVNGATLSKGTITLNKKFTAGPFMSSFSGLGVTPDLKLKPEITAHGGEILSAVPGGYDKYSGTSMAAPNMAGAAALLRQHVKGEGLTGTALNARINQLLMSSATIALNPEGNPYSPRKQGAGLANILAAVNTQAYIAVPEKEGTGYLDKTKIELGDDVNKNGVYTASFTVFNRSQADNVSYKLSSYVFTETLAINNKTVEENAHMFDDALVSFETGGATLGEGDTVTVPAGGKIDISVTVTLTENDKKYLDDSFENGMYVEGYFRLLKQGGAYADLGVPFLAFYGDWAAAPMFDYSIYDLAITDADQGIPDEDKPKASARETTPLGLYNDAQYIMPLGSYLYNQNEEEVEIFPSSDKAAISMYDDENRRTIYELYMIYGGLLRGAKTLHITITDAVTGETVYDKTENNVRKAYANGGSNVGSPIMIEMNPYEWGLANNREYIFKMKGTLDWKDGKANNDEFEFNFHVDYEAPSIESYSVRFEPYVENKETKYRIWLDVNVYDNQYVASLLPCYVKDNKLMLMTEYVIPVDSMKNSITQISFEITDFYEDYYDEIYLGVEDYALNQSLYHLNLKNATKFCEKLDYEQEAGKLVQTDVKTATSIINGQSVKSEYGVYALKLAPNESYTLKPSVSPNDTYAYKLDWQTSNSSVAIAGENEIFAKKAGTAIVSVKDGNGLTKAQITVTVSGAQQEISNPERLTFRPAVNKDNYIQSLETNGTTIELYPNTRLELKVDVNPWYLADGLKLDWTSSNPAVAEVDENGVLITHKKGIASVTASVEGFSHVSAMLRVSVVSEYRIVYYTLYEYHGSPDVVIPDELNVMRIDEDCFSGNREIRTLVLPKTLTEIGENCFKNCTSLTEVTIPSETTIVGKSAFEGCVSLKRINLKKFIDEEQPDDIMTGAVTVANRGFYNCISLDEIVNSERLTTVGREAFKGCVSLKNLVITGLAVSYESAFEGCTSLNDITLSAFTNPSVGMFKNCTALETVNYPMNAVSDSMFEGCVKLKTINFTRSLSYIGARAFAQTALTSVTMPSGDVRVGAYAFKDCKELTSVALGTSAKVNFIGIKPFDGCEKFTKFELPSGSASYTVDGGILYNAGKTQIVAVPEAITSVTSVPSGVKVIGNNVFAGKTSLKSFNFNGITEIGDYAFAGSGLTSISLPSSIEYIGKGAFEGCLQLASVDISNTVIDRVSDRVFASCDSLKTVTLPNSVASIGNSAFENSAIESVSFGSAQSIGDYAFRKTKLVTLILPSTVEHIGKEAFASIPSLSSASVSAVKTMGAGAFENCSVLSTVTFADGAQTVGIDAFAWMPEGLTTASSPLKTVTLPDSIKSVGAGAFYGCINLKSVNLKEVKTIGAYAFCGSGIESVDTKAETIGDLAFYNCSALTAATLNGTQAVGIGAFCLSALQTVNMNAVISIGANAFTGTRLTEVTLPDTISSYSYERTLTLLSLSSGKYEDRQIFEPSVGSGAFSSIPTLTSISVDNEAFFSEDGVLYARTANGYTLVQYPANREGEQYSVKNGTIRIEADAFNGVTNLKSVTFPAQLRSVGARAFYNSSVKDYTFRGVAAPVLDSEYVDVTGLGSRNILYTLFATTGNLQLGSQVYYANFYDYVAKRTEAKKLNENGHNYTAPSFNLSVTYPENGSGYDNLVWQGFFETRTLSAYAADDLTLMTNEAIAAIPSTSDIGAVATLDALNELSANYVATARALYNSISDEKQLALVNYETLKNAEIAVRNARTRLGSPAKITSLKIASDPKLRYFVGETFDPTGMTVIAVYDDASEEEVGSYTVDKTAALTADDRTVTVTYNGVSVSFRIAVEIRSVFTITFTGEYFEEFTVQVEEGLKAEAPTAPKQSGYRFGGWYDESGEAFDFDKEITSNVTLTAKWTQISNEGLSGGAIAGIVVAAVIVVAGAGVAVFFVLKKKSVGKEKQTKFTEEKKSDKSKDSSEKE